MAVLGGVGVAGGSEDGVWVGGAVGVWVGSVAERVGVAAVAAGDAVACVSGSGVGAAGVCPGVVAEVGADLGDEIGDGDAVGAGDKVSPGDAAGVPVAAGAAVGGSVAAAAGVLVGVALGALGASGVPGVLVGVGRPSAKGSGAPGAPQPGASQPGSRTSASKRAGRALWRARARLTVGIQLLYGSSPADGRSRSLYHQTGVLSSAE
jgi:hypothetical protein